MEDNTLIEISLSRYIDEKNGFIISLFLLYLANYTAVANTKQLRNEMKNGHILC